MQHQRVRPVPGDLRSFVVRNVDVWLTPALTFRMQEALDQLQPNHWARIWPSSLALSRWLLDQVHGSLPVRARELGCGLGLVSMTLAHLGVETEGTDREPAAIAFARSNAGRNDLHGFTASLLDWSEPHGAATQLMAAADIMYERESPARVFALLETSGLLAPGGRLLIGGPRARRALLGELVARLGDEGYAHVEELRLVDWEGRTQEVDVHVLTRPARESLTSPCECR
jgi:predicted nicotinamide N-methyase